MESTKICYIEGVNKLLLQSKNEIDFTANDDKVVNIYNNNQGVSISMEYI
jgi:hypothetical protein